MTKTMVEEHPELFHYTSAAGLQGILRSQTLWATHAEYLNDSAEMRAFAPRLPDILRPVVMKGIVNLLKIPANQTVVQEAGGEAAAIEQIVQGIATGMYNTLLGTPIAPPFIEPYVLSFCTHGMDPESSEHGLLSQWRGYGHDGGYVVVFETARPEALIHEESKKWDYALIGGDVIYSSDSPEKISQELGESTDLIETSIAPWITESPRPRGSRRNLFPAYSMRVPIQTPGLP